jgi:hypothetical protein
MKELYLAFVDNPALEVTKTDAYDVPQLMIRSVIPIARSTPLHGVGFMCFPLPDDTEVPHDLNRHFNDEFTFVNSKGIRHIQLGPATLLNVSGAPC